MGIFDSALIEKEEEKSNIIPDFDIALKVPSTEEMTQKQDILLKFEDNFQILDDSITEDYKLYQDYTKQLDDLELQLQDAEEEMKWKLTQDYNKIRDLHNVLVEKLQADTAQQKKVYQEYNVLRESYDKDIEIYNKKATAQNKEYTKAVSDWKQTFKEPQLEPDIPPEKPIEVPSSQFGIHDLNKPEQMGKIQKGIISAFGTWEAKKKANPELQKMEDFGSEVLSEANKWAEELKGEDWEQSGSSPEQVAIIYERITGESKEEALTDIKSQKDLNIFFVNPPEKYKEAVKLHRQLEDIFMRKAEPGKDLIGQLGWSGMVAIMGTQTVAGLMDITPKIWKKLTIKVTDKKISFKEGLDAILKTGHGEGTAYQRKIFNEAVKQADTNNISVTNMLKKGLTITDIQPRFAFGNKLYAGLPADEIVKSLVEVGKVSAEAVKGLDPVKVSQVTQQLLNINPALASEFLKAVEKPEGIAPTKEEAPKQPWQMTKEEYLGESIITKEANAKDLKVLGDKQIREIPPKPFMEKYNIHKDEGEYSSLYIVSDKGKPIARYDGNTLVVDKSYRREGIGLELVKDFRTNHPEIIAKHRTKKTQALQEKAHSELVSEALSKGEPVPAEVLADYPELQGKPTPKALEPLAEEARKYGSAEEFERAVYKKEKDLMEFYYDEAKKIKSTPTSIEADAEKSHKDIISNLNKWQVLEKKAEKQKEILWNMPKYKGINLTDFYKQAAAKPVGEGERVDLSRPDVLWHSSPSGDLRGSHYGLHIGTKKAAEQALYARIGVPADGKGWNGTSEYGKTLLAGKETLKKLGIDNTGFNVDIPENDFYPKEGIAKYSSGEIVSLKAKPTVMPVKIKGEMTNTPYTSMEDFKANSIMQGQLKRGSAKRGYYYKNASEDEGSVSAVVPGSEHLEILQQPTPVPKPEVKPEPTKKDFEALKTTDKNKELFYEKYNNVYTETKKGYDRLIEGRIAELKEEGFKGIEKGGLKKTEEGEVVGSYPAISNNPKWYRDFYKANDRQPTNKDLREIAIKQLSEGYVGDYGEVSANKIFTTLNTQLETLDIVLSDIKEGNYSFEVSGNTLKLNKELDKLRKEIGKVKKDYEAQLAKQITESQKKFIKLSGELAKQKEISVKKDLTKIKSLESERQKAGEAIEKLKSKLKEVKSKIIKPKKKSIKTLAREFSGQIDKKIEIAENEILQLVLRGEAKAARKAFSLGKKEGIFTQKEHFAEVVGRAKERKAKSEEIGKIKNILKKTNLKELRPERQKAIKNIIDDIDLKRMTEKTKRKLNSRLDFIKDNPDNQIPPEKIAELERLNKKPIADFTAEDITLIKNAILHEINLNKLKNKYIFGKQIKDASEVLKTARSNIIKGKDIKKDSASIIDSSITEHETFGQRIKRLWKLDSWNPETICEELDSRDHGEIMSYVYNGIDKGVTDKIRIDQEIDNWFADKLKDIKMDNWSKAFQPKKKNVDFQEIKLSGYELPDGKKISDRTIKITKGERISFLLHEKNEKNLNHLLKGGFRIADNIVKKHYLSEDNLNEIISSATKDEVKVANVMWEFFNEKMKPKLNEASMELNGWEVATEDNYFPIRTVQLDRKRDMLKARKTFSDKTLEGMGIFKERTNASNALILEDAFNVVTKHLEQTSSYIGMAKPLRYAKLLLEDTELQENIRQVYDKQYIDNLKDYLQRIEDNSTNVDNFDKLTIEAINKLDIAILGMHIFISFKQPVSYLIAGTEMDTKYLRKGLIAKNVYAEIKKYSPQLKQRLDGQINREMGELGNVGKTRQLFLHKSPLNNKLLWMIRATDTVTIGKIWNAVKVEIKEKYPDLSGEEFFEKVTERAEEVIRRTQPTWHIKDRSGIGRSGSIWVRLLTKYTSQRNKNVNALKRAQLTYNRSEHTAGDKINLLRKVTTVLITSALMIEAINELRRRAYGTKSKGVWDFAINTVATAVGNFYFTGDIFNSLKSKIQKGTYAGYDTGNIVSSYIDNALDGLAELGRTLEQLKTQERYKSGSRKSELKWKSTVIRALDRNASTLLAFKGLPYDNLKRLLSGMWKMAGDEGVEAKGTTKEKRFATGKTSGKKEKRFSK